MQGKGFEHHFSHKKTSVYLFFISIYFFHIAFFMIAVAKNTHTIKKICCWRKFHISLKNVAISWLNFLTTFTTLYHMFTKQFLCNNTFCFNIFGDFLNVCRGRDLNTNLVIKKYLLMLK